jgi:hypothetical protein
MLTSYNSACVELLKTNSYMVQSNTAVGLNLISIFLDIAFFIHILMSLDFDNCFQERRIVTWLMLAG